MNEQFKGYAVLLSALALFIGSLAAVGYVRTYSSSIQPSSYRSFSVTGDAKVTVTPDVAEFTFSVLSQGDEDLGSLQTENTTKVNKAIAYVKSLGIEPKDIETQNYSVEPRYQYYNCQQGVYQTKGGEPCPPPEIVGYTVAQSVSVKIREKDFGKIGQALSGVVKNGANSVSGLSFVIDDPDAAKSQARAKAIAKARAKAVDVAGAGGFRVGRLLSIDEGGYYQPMYAEKSMMLADGRGGPMAAPAPAIEPGSHDVSVSVTLRYEIQ
ncbi:MAG: hypothetical protein A3A32_03570 [Candidatus Wildermuthbacteria bacterium RIFCSPLOWO2_01_FULL_48_35]|uniref:26 kDa periplasmic immunogenic protein n=2 Tax=Parcubacteria group TaxID=1794811 RepID=A0A1G2RPV9_9BACT|nr:MAG: 26 kDa periplasmic immunogenic protein [Parcubacteria group bacterium GW2011_GWA2_47_10]OGZ93985.1 MAG: hypothetical protein A2633_00905 [Candidatus Sungbacteria bacterium RIFCSPHIGHO2_01_FULL_47_32]OHA74900.1 MAG: hypothetical protein A3A32_03570 [Candidatus Wildermuthbacteria bacterium RIFCSPLOWO2_01_FULL_48_35]